MKVCGELVFTTEIFSSQKIFSSKNPKVPSIVSTTVNIFQTRTIRTLSEICPFSGLHFFKIINVSGKVVQTLYQNLQRRLRYLINQQGGYMVCKTRTGTVAYRNAAYNYVGHALVF